MLLSSWKRPLSLTALTLAVLGFGLSLGIHLAAWGGINADLSVPWLVQLLRVVASNGVLIAAIAGLRPIWDKQWRATYAICPAWLRNLLKWGSLLLLGYALLYSAVTFGASAGTEEAAATLKLRSDSRFWLLAYWIFLETIIQYSWGWHLLMPRNMLTHSAPR